jgi:hypothetical protein
MGTALLSLRCALRNKKIAVEKAQMAKGLITVLVDLAVR